MLLPPPKKDRKSWTDNEKPFYSGVSKCPEMDLWSEVVIKAYKDVELGVITMHSPNWRALEVSNLEIAKRSARWLLRNSRDRAFVCGLIGLNPDWVAEAVQKKFGDNLAKLLALNTRLPAPQVVKIPNTRTPEAIERQKLASARTREKKRLARELAKLKTVPA